MVDERTEKKGKVGGLDTGLAKLAGMIRGCSEDHACCLSPELADEMLNIISDLNMVVEGRKDDTDE